MTSIRKDIREQYPGERYRTLSRTMAQAFRSWISMYSWVLDKHSQEGKWLFIHYDQILDGSALRNIENAIDTKVDASFVDPALKRSPNAAESPSAAMLIYRRLCSLAGHVEPAPSVR